MPADKNHLISLGQIPRIGFVEQLSAGIGENDAAPRLARNRIEAGRHNRGQHQHPRTSAEGAIIHGIVRVGREVPRIRRVNLNESRILGSLRHAVTHCASDHVREQSHEVKAEHLHIMNPAAWVSHNRGVMSNVPADLKYTKSHEWVRLEGDVATIGITDHAQSELGDVVFVELPSAGRSLSAGDTFGSVESVKTVSDIYAPIGGEVLEVNESLGAQSELVNTAPYDGGWLIKIRVSSESEVQGLLSPEQYEGVLN